MLEKLGIGGGNLEREERERYRLNMVPVENQLPAGVPTEQEQRRLEASRQERFEPQRQEDEYEYVELEQRQRREPQRMYMDEERDPYGQRDRYQDRYEAPLDVEPEPLPERSRGPEPVDEDPWA